MPQAELRGSKIGHNGLHFRRENMPSDTFHPQLDDDGNRVLLQHPSTPTDLSSWTAAGEVATVVPKGPVPAEINGVAFTGWTDLPCSVDDWNAVPGQSPIEEPPFCPPQGKMEAAGVVIEETDGRIWLVSPSNGFGGYQYTFPKGRVEQGVNRQATAIREAYEESGLQVEITGFFADSDRSQSYTRYYTARRVGGSPSEMGWETQAVHLVPKEKLSAFLTNKNDLPLLAAILSSSGLATKATDIVKNPGAICLG